MTKKKATDEAETVGKPSTLDRMKTLRASINDPSAVTELLDILIEAGEADEPTE